MTNWRSLRDGSVAIAGLAVLLPPFASPAEASGTDPAPSGPRREAGTGWAMPWQLTPASTASVAQGENTYLAIVPGYGWVRGTRFALRFILAPLPTSGETNVTVAACREAVRVAATRLGAVKVEAAPVGPSRPVEGGYVGPVVFRILYPRVPFFANYEIRVGTLDCKVDQAGNVLDVRA